jgi:signal peptidase I
MKEKIVRIPSTGALEAELERSRYRIKFKSTLRSTIFSLITIAAVAVLISTLALPVFRIYGTSMTPTLDDGNLIVALKGLDFEKGDIIAFYYNNKILVKRVIATSGDWVDIDEQGNVKVNEQPIDEPYVHDKAFGKCNIALPYQVPESRVFVMGDHRSTSIDSRNSEVGCISQEQIIGKLKVRIWPIKDASLFK